MNLKNTLKNFLEKLFKINKILIKKGHNSQKLEALLIDYNYYYIIDLKRSKRNIID